MFSIMYTEVVQADNGTFSLLYYILNFSGNYLSSVEGEKEYSVRKSLSQNQLYDTFADMLNAMGSDIDSLVVITDTMYKDLVCDCINGANDRLYVRREAPFEVRTISEFFGHGELTMYELYCLVFGTPVEMPKVDLIDRLMTYIGLQYENRETAFITVYLERKQGYFVLSACWMTLNYKKEVTILGNKSVFFEQNGDNYIRLNQYISTLRLEVAKSGLSFDALLPVFYSKSDYIMFSRWISRTGVEVFNKPLYCMESLQTFTCKLLQELAEQSAENFLRLCTASAKGEYRLSARELALAFREFNRYLPLQYHGDTFSSDVTYTKDFSADAVALDSKGKYKYCIVLDCEGTQTGGCAEVGGIIAAYADGVLYKAETFYFKHREFSEGMLNIVKRFEQVTNRYLPVKGIPVLTYGNTDSNMINTELAESVPRTARRKIEKSFEFRDCQDYISAFVDSKGISCANKQLSTVAASIGVTTVLPKHNALNDAKTLFNVLAMAYMAQGEFVL